MHLPAWVVQTSSIFGLFLVWTVASRFVAEPAILPSPAASFQAMADLIARGTLTSAVQESLITLVIGCAICIICVVPFALLIAQSRQLAMILQPMVRFISCVPAIALIPLFIVWFGFSTKAVYATLFYTSAIPLLFSVITGVQKIPRVYADGLRPLGAGPFRIVRDVYLPGAMPGIEVGIRLALSYGWRAVIAGELIIGSSGLGRVLAQARAANQVDQIIAVMIAIAVLFLIIDRLILFPWNRLISSRWSSF
ncbi:ABC transporter permease [Sinorhizobium americanum]|uniref:ABC transporter permease n=1 Tax=Sinorhizobium americanum TaxID=194963 RepID=UPI00093219B9|nr:ABC transporter permease [Sinorhizobium americanum]